MDPDCSCRFSSAWRCANDQGLTSQVTCWCYCHRRQHLLLLEEKMFTMIKVDDLQHALEEARRIQETCPQPLSDRAAAVANELARLIVAVQAYLAAQQGGGGNR